MIENIKSLVKGEVEKVISGEREISAEQKSKVVDVASNSFVKELQNFAKGKDGGNLISMLSNISSGGSGSKLLQKNIESAISSSLVSIVKLDKGVSNKLAGLIVPAAMSILGKNSKSGGIDLGSLLGELTGGGSNKSSSNVIGMLGKLMGKR